MPARPGRRGELRPEVLDHDFLVAQHFVHVQGDALRGAAERSRPAVVLPCGSLLRGEACSSAPDQ